MSQEKSEELNTEDFTLLFREASVNSKAAEKKHKRHQGIIGLIKRNPSITMEEMAKRLDVHERTIK